ncbi:RHS repeat protein [Butyrivibrio sp. XPD2002]|uniref:RHS repeat protein n=1 Tax=Butyrivibrio sp. XPD2002 TaxID=1280665 RepID=UPI0003F95078|nr:RHS repeat protein [Butyrivibrio sp. XPD2002]
MEKRLVSWKDYLFIGLAIAVMMEIRVDSREQFFQLLLIAVFFVFTGLKENAGRLWEFVCKFPVYAAATVAWTIFFVFINREKPYSDKYAISVFGIIFVGYLLAKKGEEYVRATFDKMWLVYFILSMCCFVNFIVYNHGRGRMLLFFQNPNWEGYSLIFFLFISLFFVESRAKMIVGTIYALVALPCTGGKANTLVAVVVVAGYIIRIAVLKKKNSGNKQKQSDSEDNSGSNIGVNNKRKKAMLIAGSVIVLVAVLVLLYKFGKGTVDNLWIRYKVMMDDLMRVISGKGQPADSGTSTTIRIMDALESLETYPTKDILKALLGRGLMHQYNFAIRPMTAKLFAIAGGGIAGPAENTFLSMMYDSGAAGFSMYGAVYVASFISFIKSKDAFLRKLALILISIMTIGLTVDMEYLTAIMFVEWIVVGMFLGRLDDLNEKRMLAPGLVGFGLLIPVIYILPKCLSWVKTMTNGVTVVSSGSYAGAVPAVIVIIAVAILGLICAISISSYRMFSIGRLLNRDIIRMAVFMLVIIGGGVFANSFVAKVQGAVTERVAAEREFIEELRESTEGRLYVDTFPVVYDRALGDISNTVLCSRGLVVYDDTTIIADKSLDSHMFSSRGFLYAPISEWDAIYTNDEAVIRALDEKGVRLYGYNPEVKTLDILKGNRAFIYPGKYEVSYDISIEPNEYKDDYLVCELKVTNTADDSKIYERHFYRSQFDENGHLIYDDIVTLGYYEAEFTVEGGEEYGLIFDKVEYARKPDYDQRIKVDYAGRTIFAQYFDLEGNPYEQSGGYYGTEFEYDDNDNNLMTRYLGEDLQPVEISSGYAEVRREYNARKCLKKESYFGADGNLILLSGGYAEIRKKYNDKDQLSQDMYYGTDGNPVVISGGYVGVAYEYDSYGRVKKYTYLGEDGNPVVISSGYAVLRREYNDKDLVVREEYYDVDDNPLALTYGQAAVEYEYDDNLNRVVDRYYDTDNQPILYNDAFWYVQRTYNEDKRCVKEEYFGTDGNPIEISSGQASVEYEYDDHGNAVEYRYLGVDGNPVIITSGYAVLKKLYNQLNQLEREEYLDENGDPVALAAGQGFVEYEYDEAGNRVIDRYYDADGNPVNYNDAYWYVSRTYNEDKRCVKEEYFGTDNKPRMISAGYAAYTIDYDEDGRAVKYVYLGTDGMPVINSSGYAVRRCYYNDDNQLIREEYYDADDVIVELSGGQASVEYEYDEAGNRIIDRYYNIENQPVLYNDSYWCVLRTYDEKKRCVKEEYLGTDNKPILLENGYAGYTNEYDDKGLVTKNVYLGVDGDPVITASGYAISHHIYNDDKRLIRDEFYDKNDKPMACFGCQSSVEYEYDDAGNRVVDRYYGLDGEPVLCDKGYWYVSRTFDEKKRVIREEYYGINDEPVNTSDGYSSIEYVYEDNGALLEKVFRDVNGNEVEEED